MSVQCLEHFYTSVREKNYLAQPNHIKYQHVPRPTSKIVIFLNNERGRGLTSVGDHHFLDWSILVLWGRVGGAREQARPPDGQHAEASPYETVPHHPETKRVEKGENSLSNREEIRAALMPSTDLSGCWIF